MILPGATLGMLGGGQLGRMFTVAARTMGYHVIVLDPDPDSPAGRMADEHLHAAYSDEWALQQLAKNCDVVTTEFENVPAATLRSLETHCVVRPSARALELTQDRIREKIFISETGMDTATFRAVYDPEGLQAACKDIKPPYILKRSSLGYDGKGQFQASDLGSAQTAFAKLGKAACVLEQKIDLEKEISVVLGRSSTGSSVCFPVVENEHSYGILNLSMVPARVDNTISHRAEEMAITLANALDFCGVLAVEFFVTRDGRLLVNEIAPRVHNSGHYTLDSCKTSQFEQQVRMICDLPAGNPALLSPVVMVNLLGDLWIAGVPRWEFLLQHPDAKLHLYGKRQARPGRKMGHMCYLDDDLDRAELKAREILRNLG
jgi:5-(carboxyamino)imidazole ribonucleotide synthase